MKEEYADLIGDFKDENLELLESMEKSLLEIQESGVNDENINAVFRAAHTIKGSSGMFEIGYLVKFAHAAENLLDAIRKKKLVMSDPMVNTLFEVKDQLLLLLNLALTHDAPPGVELEEQSERLCAELNGYLDGSGIVITTPPKRSAKDKSKPTLFEPVASPPQKEIPHITVSVPPKSPFNKGIVRKYKLSISFFGNSIANGIDPMEFIKTLKLMGEVSDMRTELSDAQDILNFSIDESSLKFVLDYKSDRSIDEIKAVFEIAKHLRDKKLPALNLEP